MTGRQVLAAIVAIVVATAVLPPAVARAVHQRRMARARSEVVVLADRLRAGGTLAERDLDPWGNRYILQSSSVISRGPNGLLETPSGSAPAGDDIAAPVSSSSR
jgi:hypothetical protein